MRIPYSHGRRLAFACVLALSGFGGLLPASSPDAAGKRPERKDYSVKRMEDGKPWTAVNLNVAVASSYCYADVAANCAQYGRLYKWGAAANACQSLGKGWRLPSEEDWRRLAKAYGGGLEDSKDRGQGAYKALMDGGPAGFNAVLGGGRSEDGKYERLNAHGF